MASNRVRLGDLLVEARIITREDLEQVLEQQRGDGRRLGTLLVESGVVTETQVTQILSQQLSVPWVSLYHIDFSRQLLDLVPREMAEKYCLVPIFVRRVRGLGEALYVAMDDPGDENAQREVSQFAGLPVRAMIAPPSDIRGAIRAYYRSTSQPSPDEDTEGSGTTTDRAPSDPPEGKSHAERELERAARRVSDPPPAPAPAESKAEPKPEEAVIPPPARAPTIDAPMAQAQAPQPPPSPSLDLGPDSGPQIEAREITMPRPRRGSTTRFVTLTLLDGTQVNLPANPGKKGAPRASAAPDAEQLTARDLVAALRAVAHGADATEILGEKVHWEAMFAALLSVLLKKHLIADWDFVDEYKNI
jgi:type IV pilus assembly protein PilB